MCAYGSLVLTERKDHLECLAQRFCRFVRNLAVLRGGLSAKDRRKAQAALNVAGDEERLIMATGRYVGEGFDDARLDTLFLTMPIAWKGTLAQYVGRLHRQHDGKKDVLVVDYVDDAVPVLAPFWPGWRQSGGQDIVHWAIGWSDPMPPGGEMMGLNDGRGVTGGDTCCWLVKKERVHSFIHSFLTDTTLTGIINYSLLTLQYLGEINLPKWLGAIFYIAFLFSTQQAHSLEVIIRTFIPKAHPSKNDYILSVPGQSDKTMLPDAPGPGQCFGTDDRNFSDTSDASSRFGGVITIDPANSQASMQSIHGTTREYDCATGSSICTKTAGKGGFQFKEITKIGDRFDIRYRGEASNPCLTLAPDIEFYGVITVDKAAKTVSLNGKVDCFPSFEAVLVKDDSSRVFLYKMDPDNEATPICLADPTGHLFRDVSSGTVPY